MKTIIALIGLTFLTHFVNAQNDATTVVGGTTITVTVPVTSNEGSILVGLDDEAHFMQKGIQSAEGIIKDGKAVVTFSNVAPGEYAIVLFHDKNSNKQMDFDMNGMPLESYGVSNNVMSYGPPQWSDAKFEVTDQPVSMEIRM